MVDIVCADTVTALGPEHRGQVLIGGSHGGVYAGYLAAKAGVRAVILHNAGIGKDEAGIGALAYLDQFGLPVAALDHMSARIADGYDQLARGTISHVNKTAAALGCTPGQDCRTAAELMTAAVQWSGPSSEFGESHFLLRERVGQPLVWGVDSTSLLRPEDNGAVMITASHGALFASAEKNRSPDRRSPPSSTMPAAPPTVAASRAWPCSTAKASSPPRWRRRVRASATRARPGKAV